MQPCTFCGTEIPSDARFCGKCGQPLSDETKSNTQITTIAELGEGWPDFPVTPSLPPLSGEWQTEQNRDQAAGLILPLSALELGQFSHAQAPMVQGTPQVGHVPSIQGTPSAPTSASPGYAAAPPLRASRASHTLASHAHASHATHVAASASKIAAGTAAKWLIVVVTAVVVLATSGVIFVLASAPALSLSGSGSVSVGGTLQIHGKGFLPGGNIAFTLDQGLPIAASYTHVTSDTARTGAANAFILSASANRAASNLSVAVSVAGTFDANVQAQSSWSPGQHTIHATENLGSRSANLPFTMLSTITPASLMVQPTTLSFKVQQGSRTVQSIGISNGGQATLNWTATTAGSPWLILQGVAGEIGSHASNEFIDVIADASHLKVGTYTATIQVNSNAGQAQVAVTLQVLAPSQKKQAQLNVTPTTLDFGPLVTGQKLTLPISLGNLGTADLNWSASAGNANWLTLDTASGTVKQGAIPQMLHVSVDTSSLQAGSYTATLVVTSNGGNAHVAVTLAVMGITPTPSPTLLPTPTLLPSPSPSPTVLPPSPTVLPPSPTVLPPSPSPSPTVLPPTWSVSPASLDSSTCGLSGPCTVTLTEGSGSAGSIGWTASSDVNAVFNPASGTLSPGVPLSVSISGMACQGGTFTFTATIVASPQTLSVPWTCTPQTPTGTAILGTCTYAAGTGWSCPLAITADTTNQVVFPWGTSSSGISGITFTPPSGSLPPGQSATTTVTIPDGVCPASALLLVTTPGKGLPVSWSCTAPTLTVTVNTATCPAATNGWTCTMTLSLVSGSQGQLAWTSSASSNLPGTTFSPANGTLSVGQSVTENVSIPSSDCTNGSFNFTGNGGNTATVTWNCPATG